VIFLERVECPQSGASALEQAGVILSWLRLINLNDLKILDADWLCGQLTPFGRVTGTDLSD